MSDSNAHLQAYLNEIKRSNQLSDKFIGSLMLLVYEGCISDSRARELIGMDIYKWRQECRRVFDDIKDEPKPLIVPIPGAAIETDSEEGRMK